MGLNWKEFELPGKRLPKWKRTFAVEQETGQVFVAAALTGDAEHLVSICASDDGLPVYTLNDHYYVPADWLGREFPAVAALCSWLFDSISGMPKQ
ncbi:hypothetical protein F7R01_10280 [Pseudomonas argentinensis]|uniref:Uncharacterized protein n=1 Tax=Phytopseudomonas argentinensis TaxID=289370 RepID=A0A1I3I7Q4_9GAMM|nr:hypothetical protein [Pseudomonas argentinensis]KAB0547878.1 hypothetical protein F7R01_10280 [Pseudomonas argentinensis]SFI43773.1 hypothetical protein SAMN05216602_1470 [Pseudomonas argentinensis]